MQSSIQELRNQNDESGKPHSETGRTEYSQPLDAVDKDDVDYEVHWRTYTAILVACLSYIVISIPVNIAGFQAGTCKRAISRSKFPSLYESPNSWKHLYRSNHWYYRWSLTVAMDGRCLASGQCGHRPHTWTNCKKS